MRVHIKGGVWKNSEDEILKAAVMKYGLYQWGRIASLMNRKSAKQCKARWYEWLDPSIKKTEWSLEEDEKLLHAAKIMPCQWRSISTMVGRTAAQCLKRYEKLLDAAVQEKQPSSSTTEDDSHSGFGQLISNPENRPALPDAIDMEEDEKEMIQEARARMANTKGKKAKRKAREKQLEEARRLAILQRKREMKAAGIDVTQTRKSLKEVNYNREIPFFHAPIIGFHDASIELSKPAPPIDLRMMTRTAREKEQLAEVEERESRQKALNEKKRLEKDPIAALEELTKVAEARQRALVRNSSLQLPAPQLTEEELSQLAKLVYEPDIHDTQSLSANNTPYHSTNEGYDGSQPDRTPTQGLLSSYKPMTNLSSTAANLSQSTSSTPRPNHIMLEASNQAKLRGLQTPLSGVACPELIDSGFRPGLWKDAMKTPNPLATPHLGTTSSSTNSSSNNPTDPVLRDFLGLNTPRPEPSYDTERQSCIEARLQRQKLGHHLANLPTPKYTEFSIELNDGDEADSGSGKDQEASYHKRIGSSDLKLAQPHTKISKLNDLFEQDAYDVEQRRKRILVQSVTNLIQTSSQAFRHRHLPCPILSAKLKSYIDHDSSFNSPTDTSNHISSKDHDLSAMAITSNHQISPDRYQQIMTLLRSEMAKLVSHDVSLLHSLSLGTNQFSPSSSMQSQPKTSWLEQSESLISSHLQDTPGDPDQSFQDFQSLWTLNFQSTYYDTQLKRYLVCHQPSDDLRLCSIRHEFSQISDIITSSQKRIINIEKRLGIVQGGYLKRSQMISNQIQQLTNDLYDAKISLSSFQKQRLYELEIMPQRLLEAKERYESSAFRERVLQSRFESLLLERDHLLADYSNTKPSQQVICT